MHEQNPLPRLRKRLRLRPGARRMLTYPILAALVLVAIPLLPKILPASTPAIAAPAVTSSSPTAKTAPTPAPTAVSSTESNDADRALTALRGIPVAPAEQIDYDEGIYGPKWADIAHSGCDTRNTILQRDLVDVAFKPGTHDCVVARGTLHDAYTGQTVTFTRVSGGYQPVQIDHVVPRATAAAHGALHLTPEQRLQFANDPLNLQTTTANQKKGNRGPAEYMPTAAYACTYAIRYVEVSAKYSLSMDAADHAVLEKVLADCAARGGS